MIFFTFKKNCDHPKFFFRFNIMKLWTKLDKKLCYKLNIQFHLIFLLLDVNFDKSTIELHFLLYHPCSQNFNKIKGLITMSLIKYLNFKFL